MAPDCVYFLYIADTLRPLAPIAPTLVQHTPLSPLWWEITLKRQRKRGQMGDHFLIGPLRFFQLAIGLFPCLLRHYWLIRISHP